MTCERDIMYTVKLISAEDTIIVRHPVLRKGRPIEDCVFEDDTVKTTFHLGLFEHDKMIGVATFLKNSNSEFDATLQYQLRGMAILESHQGKGLGAQLLAAGEKELIKRDISLLWFNAREVAWNFYKRHGYTITGDVFNIGTIGNHLVMYKSL